MKLGVITEPEGENRIAIVPNSIPKLSKAGFKILVESGAGTSSSYSDAEFESRGASVTSRDEALSADILVTIHMPDSSELKQGQVVACVADPFRHPERVKQCMESSITLLSMDMIPRRLSRAQSMDVNSSQDNLAGYKAVLMGAAHLGKAIPMMTTSAGTVKPAKFVIMGSGVAGLQAIATAKRLGAIVFASDVRKSAAEQIESGYAKPLTPEFIQKVNDTVCEVAKDADVIVTTARIFGRPAPITVPADAVASFKQGAVIVDMNADVGGNCELTKSGQTIVQNGITIVGIENLPGTIASTASMLYSNNLTNFVTSLMVEGELTISMEDDVLVGAEEGSDFHVPGMGGVLICSNGEIHPKQSRLSEVVG